MIRIRRLLVLSSLFAGAGCFTTQPVSVGVAPESGSRVTIEINDAGRVALSPLMGPEIDRIDGMLLEKDTAGMTIAVKNVFGFRGGVQVWSDEKVRIEDVHIRAVTLRRFSRGRTVAFGAAGVGGITFLVNSGLASFFFGDETPSVPTDTTGQSILRLIRP